MRGRKTGGGLGLLGAAAALLLAVGGCGGGSPAPTADAGPDQTVTDTDDSGAQPVTLDGTESRAPAGGVVSYVWREDGGEIATGVQPTVTLAVGPHALTLTVTDGWGRTASDTVSVTVLPPTTATVRLEDVSPASGQRWMDLAGNLYSSAFQASYSYSSAVVWLTYEKRETTFVAVLDAAGLKPNFAYQVKLVGGDRVADVWSFEAIGYLGRWWLSAGGPNFYDADYEANRDDPSVTIASYILFDYFVTDNEGGAHATFVLDSSFHVLWSEELNSSFPGPLDSSVVAHAFTPDAAAYASPSGTPTTQHLWLENEDGLNERPAIGEAQLPAGTYPAYLQLTEESFHQSGLGGSWATVLSAPVTFEVDEP